uniref:DDE_Tnp_1_7 domain-containing protein n=1 Tax=Rhodnius prolixus TaxID=13249 RepID=T1HKK0_RHOPR
MIESESEYEYANLSESGSEESDNCSSDSKDSSEEEIADDWKAISNVQRNPAPQRFPFVAAAGSTFFLEDNFDILAYFKLFFDDSVLDLLVLETNRYSEQEPSRSDSQWKHVDKNEMIVFLGILLGLIKNQKKEYIGRLTKHVVYTIYGNRMIYKLLQTAFIRAYHL